MKNNSTKPPGYESKPAGYFELARSEMLQFVPAGCKRVLDVGCSQGNFGELLKKDRQVEVWGLEPVASAIAEAATKLDRAIEGVFTPDADLPPASFDAITFNDVLEHIWDPWASLAYARTLLAPGGAVVASIPNIRHYQAMCEVVLDGDWRYRGSGIFDRTHMRFYTRKSIVALFTDAGYQVDQIVGINPFWSDVNGRSCRWGWFKLLNTVTFKAIDDMKFLQFAVVARPKKS